MEKIRIPRARAALVAAVLGCSCALAESGALAAARDLDGDIRWYEDDRRSIAKPAERDPHIVTDFYQATFVRPAGRFLNPGRLARRVGGLFGGEHSQQAANVNALDEVLNSTWFTNRIALFPMRPEDVARGAGGNGPDRSAKWRVVQLKSAGQSAGFQIEDATGQRYLFKFDPPNFPSSATAAGAISAAILHAAGYNVPEDRVVEFGRGDLEFDPERTFSLDGGEPRKMTSADLDRLLERLPRRDSSTWRAISSRFLAGAPLGPFDYRGRRKDDANDRINHEDRRELRGLRMIAAWLNHYDTKKLNTLDMYVEEGGSRFVKHHLIDLASTLGAGATGPYPFAGFENGIDFPAMFGRALSFGLHEDTWRRLERPENLREIGYFESEPFDPIEFKPLLPNSAFANMTTRDGYWAAKIISAFRDRHLEAVVAIGDYENPEATAYMIRTLAERRDRIARYWFDRTPPLDFFSRQGSVVRFQDLGVERDLYPGSETIYRVRGAASTADRSTGQWSEWHEVSSGAVALDSEPLSRVLDDVNLLTHPYVALEFRVDRGLGWSRPVRVFVSRTEDRVAAVER